MKEMTLNEIFEFWEPLHKKENIKQKDIKEVDLQMFFVMAHLLTDNEAAFGIFLLSEANYNVEEADKLNKRFNRASKLAEYLHLKFSSNNDDTVKAKRLFMLNLLDEKQIDEIFDK